MDRAKKEKHTTDQLRGVLRGDAFESDCTVALVTKLDHEKPTVAVWTSLRITAATQTPPDGTYRLEVHGRTFRREARWRQMAHAAPLNRGNLLWPRFRFHSAPALSAVAGVLPVRIFVHGYC